MKSYSKGQKQYHWRHSNFYHFAARVDVTTRHNWLSLPSSHKSSRNVIERPVPKPLNLRLWFLVRYYSQIWNKTFFHTMRNLWTLNWNYNDYSSMLVNVVNNNICSCPLGNKSFTDPIILYDWLKYAKSKFKSRSYMWQLSF